MHGIHRKWLIGLAGLALICSACEQKPAPSKPTTAAPTAEEIARARQANEQAARDAAATPTAAETPTGLPPGHPPVGGNAGAASPRGTTSQPGAAPGMPPGHPPIDSAAGAAAPARPSAELVYDPPATWVSEQPTSAMRAAQFKLPRAAGDPNDGELAVFLFGGAEGGPIQGNIVRWRSQFQSAGGQPVPPAAVKQETFKVGGLTVHYVDISGYYVGMGEQTASREQRMLAAIVEMPDGKAIFKAVGPAATMAQQRDAFRKMLDTLKVHE